MLKIQKGLVIVFLMFLLLFSSEKNIHAQTYRCQWIMPGSCTVLSGCPSNCVMATPCSDMGIQQCNDARANPVQCSCSQSLNLRSLYDSIQSKGGMFSFAGGVSMGTIVSALVNYIFPIFGLILLLYLLYGGYNFMLSGGDPKKAAAAKGIITMAFIGFTIIFTSYWIVQTIGNILGLDDFLLLF